MHIVIIIIIIVRTKWTHDRSARRYTLHIPISTCQSFRPCDDAGSAPWVFPIAD